MNSTKYTMDLKWELRVRGFDITYKLKYVPYKVVTVRHDKSVIARIHIHESHYYLAKLRKPRDYPPGFAMTCFRRVLRKLSKKFGKKRVTLYAMGKLRHDTTSDGHAQHFNLVDYYQSKGFQLVGNIEYTMEGSYEDVTRKANN